MRRMLQPRIGGADVTQTTRTTVLAMPTWHWPSHHVHVSYTASHMCAMVGGDVTDEADRFAGEAHEPVHGARGTRLYRPSQMHQP